MNYYRHYLGDYMKKTSRLSTTEHGAYRLLLDYYYSEELPIPIDAEEAYAICRAIRPDDRKAVDKVLRLYFERKSDGYHNERADEEIATARSARTNGKGGGRPRTGSQTGHETESVTGQQTGIETETGTEHETGSKTDTVTGQGGGSGHPPSSILHPPTGLPASPQSPPSTQGQPPSPGGAQRPRLPRRTSNPDVSPKTVETWNRYADAYQRRYGTQPVRNATVNGQLAQVVRQLGLDEAPAVAEFYVGHQRTVYVAAKHAVNLLLRDCTGLRTEWATGHKVTDTEARNADRTAHTGDIVGRLIEESQ